MVINARHELILIRAHNGNNYIVGEPTEPTEPTLELFKVQWRMPHVECLALNEINKLSMPESERYLNMSFRSLDLYEYFLLSYNEAFLGHQDCDSAGKTTIRYLWSTD